MIGDNIDNQTLRNLLNSFDYGKANLPITNGIFAGNINRFLPEGYPTF